MWTNQGYKIQREMMELFKGKSNPLNCIDFQTKTSFYEVKSCRLFVNCVNGNDKRPYENKPHKKIKTTQLGRFHIKLRNHKGFKLASDKENKIPKYILVVVIGKQKIWEIKDWKQIDLMIHKNREVTLIRIKDIFHEVPEDE